MNTRRSIPIGVVIAIMIGLLVAGNVTAAPVEGLIIDHFDDGDSVTVVVPATGGFSFVTPANVIGGERDILVTNVTGGAEGTAVVEANPGGNSLLSVSYGATVNGDVQLQWDGVDGDAAIDSTGLGGVDLTQAGQDRFILGVSTTDLPFTLTMQIYQGANCSESSVVIPGAVSIYAPEVVEMPFSNFSACSASPAASFSSVGAIVMNISGVTNMDFQLHFFQATTDAYLDFGDAPASYGTLLADNGPRHTLTDDIYMGASDDAETDGTPDVNAAAHGDDDGVTAIGHWNDGTAQIEVVVSGTELGCLSGWVDISENKIFDGSFDSSDLVIDRLSVEAGTVPVTFVIDPGIVADEDVYARFRIVPNTLRDCELALPIPPTGTYFGGEVEDYKWSFNPTNIELQSLDARSNPSNVTAVLVAGLVVLLAAVIYLTYAYRSRRA